MTHRRIHWLRRNKRSTACGRRAKRTAHDTRIVARVTCLTCRRSLAIWRALADELHT